MARKLMDGLPDAVQKHIWDGAREEARAWPPGLHEPAAQAGLTSFEGMALVVELAIASGVAGFGKAEAEALAEAMTGDEFEALDGPAQPGRPRRPKSGGGGVKPVDWVRLARNLVEAGYGTLAEVMDMTFEQIQLISSAEDTASEGRPAAPAPTAPTAGRIMINSDEDLAKYLLTRKAPRHDG